MSKLWTFGDSFTAGHGCKYFDNPAHNYLSPFKNYIVAGKKIWNEIVADSLSLELVDLSKNGITTDTIFDTLLEHTSTITPSDIVIIQTSTVGRFDFPFLKQNTLMGTNMFDSPYFLKPIFVTSLLKEYRKESENILKYVNSQEDLKNNNLKLNKTKYDTIRNFFSEFIMTEKYYERSIWRIVEFTKILKSMGITTYIINEDIWPKYLSKPTNLMEIHPRGMCGFVDELNLTIYADTNGWINDWHPSYDGHINIANFIINFIKNETTNIHNSQNGFNIVSSTVDDPL